MQHLKKIGADLLDHVGGNKNKPPPDEVMSQCKGQLTELRDELMVVKQQFSQYAHQVVEAAEASVTLSKSVGKFYSKANHPGRTESVNTYKKVQEDIANRAVNTFHISVENGLISELSEWIQLVNNLNEKIDAAESTRITAHDTQNRLISLQTEYQEKKSKKQGLFGGNREQDLEDLQTRIAQASDAQKSLSAEYKNERNNIAQNVKQVMEKRYKYFDRMYVQMLECQAEYFQNAATQSKRFQRDIDYYRKQYPKTNDFASSNGQSAFSAIDKNHNASKQNGGGAASNGGGIGSQPKNHRKTSSDNKSSKGSPKLNGNSKKQVPQSRPPPPSYNSHQQNGNGNGDAKANRAQSPNTTQTSTQSSSTQPSSSTSPKLAPSQAQQQQQQKSKSSPPNNSNLSANNGQPHYPRQQSTHDILNLGGPMSPTQPKPQQGNNGQKLHKQESLFGGLLGGNDPVHDEHGLFNLGSANDNDLLFGNVNTNSQQPPQNNPKGQYSQSTSALDHKQKQQQQKSGHDANDPFGDDFFGAFSGAPAQNGSSSTPSKPKHQSHDSTTIWLMGSHTPTQSQTSINTQQKKPKSMEQQMQEQFGKASYGGGHAAPNGHAISPAPSSTGKAGNGTSVQPEMSEDDKKAMVNMKLSAKGQAAAKAAYDAAMAERDQKEQEAEQKEKEKAYWKDKHEQMLNKWEYDNTVRRNIRTLIGKLPDILPADLNWKPIPMTKLLNDAQLKKGYYKAVRMVHPDKSTGRGDSIEYQVICDYAFQALEQGFNTKFG
eukprot:CAMPEP_0201582754 /NCGR_PEP_ID=MMETSP0190_2-20130828/90327_1 /ASSEMBLY_ACC=CAM_ASM_000263 /TAXON_ID=37353 /ORGANISM="Rosalina sp." /LENGTH=770 /DNA_ID=CAMNT_0048023365 /DNA_START=203 /DNA_END=2515 /DNA_ORIENTATION=+